MAAVFENTASIVTAQTIKLGYKCVIIESQDKVYFEQAPATAIRIQEQVDFSLAKTLLGNFNLVTFQDLPVVITISGLTNLYTTCKENSGKQSKENIAKLYQKQKASASTQIKPTQITIDGVHYKAVIVALTQQSTEKTPGILSYSITMFGARVK